ncbi:MAG: tRNA-dihydrouridine synthase [Candidatus Bathyarchaeia archaeon]
MPDLSVEVAGVRFKNPLMVAAGTPTIDSKAMIRCMEYGAAAVVSKTITFAEMHRLQPRPRFYVMHPESVDSGFYSLYSVELMSELSPEEAVEDLGIAVDYARRCGAVVVASIAGRSIDEWVKLSSMVREAGVSMVELNLSCPHVEAGEGVLMGKTAGADPSIVERIVAAVKRVVDIPVAVKLTPHGADPLAIALAADRAGVDLVVATARFQGLVIDVDSMKPVVWGGLGGYGGPWMVPISCSWVYKIVKSGVRACVVGSGGVSGYEDVLRFLMLGCRSVQICTAIIMHGFQFITRILSELDRWLASRGFSSVGDVIGVALPNVLDFEKLDRVSVYKSDIDYGRCVRCMRCLRSCFYEAIRVADGRPVVDHRVCVGCGLCSSICLYNAITLRRIG